MKPSTGSRPFMASDTVTRRLDRARRRARGLWSRLARGLFSRVGFYIFAVNLVSLLVLTVGMLGITENRRGLVEAKILSLTAQAEIVASVITETAVSGAAPAPTMDSDAAREVLRRLSPLYVPDETRALLYAPGPVRIADSDLIAGEVDEQILPPPGEDVSRPFDGAVQSA